MLRDGTHEILNPGAAKHVASAQYGSSAISNLPLAFAFLPAVCGVLFKDGQAMITDLMLLILALIFLRYTMSQPWQWYHEAQEVRIRQEVGLETFEDESDEVFPAKMGASMTALDEVPEEKFQDGDEGDRNSQEGPRLQEHQGTRHSVERQSRTSAQEAAVRQLYIHEVLALVACFLSPVIGAFFAHTIRAYLQRTEGLVTNLNILIYLLGAEVKPMSHALKLIHARTLHLQRIVQAVPVPKSTTTQLEEIRVRLLQLELRAEAAEETAASALASAKANASTPQNGATSGKDKDTTVREVRNAIQPDIDAVTRAVRRYEKKVTIITVQTAARLGAMDARLDDAVALAAAAAKNHNRAQWGLAPFMGWLANWVVAVVTMPYFMVMFVAMWPFRAIGRLISKKSRSSRDGRDASGRSSRHSGFKGSRNGSGSEKDRYKDRVPSRLSGRFSP